MNVPRIIALVVLAAIGGFVYYAMVQSDIAPSRALGLVSGMGALLMLHPLIPPKGLWEWGIGIGLIIPIAICLATGYAVPGFLDSLFTAAAVFGVGIMHRTTIRMRDDIGRPKPVEK